VSSGADERGRENERDFAFTPVLLLCPALHRSHGLGARTTIWLSEALLEKELVIERDECERDEDRERREETAILIPPHTRRDWITLDITADLIIASL